MPLTAVNAAITSSSVIASSESSGRAPLWTFSQRSRKYVTFWRLMPTARSCSSSSDDKASGVGPPGISATRRAKIVAAALVDSC
jgi:hypothetical protein